MNAMSGPLGEFFGMASEDKAEKTYKAWSLFKSCVIYDDFSPMNIFLANNDDLFSEDHISQIKDFFYGLSTMVEKLNT